MDTKKPSYEELKKKLAEAEELLAKIRRGKTKTTRGGRDAAILGTEEFAEAYIASEQNFKNSMDASPLGIRIITEAGELIYANKAILDICGYNTAQELAAVPRNQLYSPESYKAHLERKKRRNLKEHVPAEYEISIRRPDGEVRVLQVFRREVMWGGEQQFMAMYQDITEHKQAEEALRESEEKFHTIVEHSNDGIVFIQDGIVRYCNSKMLEIGGYSQREVLGKPFIDFVAPEHKEKVFDIYSKRIAGKKAQERYKLNLLGKGGRKIYTEISASLINFKQNQVDIAIVRDITENKKTEEALAGEAVRRRILIEQSRDGIVILDQDGKVYEANQRFANMLGYSPEEVLQLSVFDWEFLLPNKRLLEMLRTVDEAGDHFETQHRRKDGTTYDVEISTNGATFAGQKLIFCVCRDITERKRMEQALRESEEKFSKAFHASPDIMAITTVKDGKFLDINDSYTQNTGYSREELIGKGTTSIDIWANEQDRARMIRLLKEYGRVNKTEFDIRTKSGETRTWLFSIEPITIGGEACLIGVSIDITARKQAEEAFRESEARFRTLFETMAQGVIYHDAEGKVISANPAAERILGMTLSQMLGKSSLDPQRKRLHEDGTNFSSEEHPSMVALRTGKPVNNVVMAAYHPVDKEYRWILINAVPEFREGEKTPYRVYSTFTDITERIKLEEESERDRKEIKLIIDSSQALVFYKDKEGKFLRVNKAFAEALNMPEEDFVGKTVFDLYSVDIAQSMTDDDREVFASGRPKLNIIEQYESATGLRWVQTDKMPVLDKNGEAIAMIGFAQDITERKAVEEALRQSEEKFSKSFRSSPDAIIISRIADGKMLEVNDAWEGLSGYSREEVLEKSSLALNLLSPLDRQHAVSLLEKQGFVREFELEVRQKSGDVIQASLSIEKIEINGERCMLTTLHDITARKQAEEAIKESEERLKEAQALGRIGSWEFDIEKQTITWSEETYVLYERDLKVGPPSPEEEARYYSPEQAKVLRDYTARAIETGQTFSYDLEVILPSGKTVYYHGIMQPIKDTQGRVVKLSGTVQDITERKRMEEKMVYLASYPETNPNLIMELDKKGNINYINPTTRSFFPDLAELGINHPYLANWPQLVNEIQDSKSSYTILREVIVNGSFYEQRIFVTKENQIRIYGIDITERKRAEQRINYLNLTLHSVRNVNQLITREKDRDKLLKGICDTLVESRSFFTAWIVLLDESHKLITHAARGVSGDFTTMVEEFKKGNLPPCVQKALKKTQVITTEDPKTMCIGCPIIKDSSDFGSMTIRLEYAGNIYGVLCASLPKEISTDKNEVALFQEVATDIAFALYNMERESEYERLEQERLRAAKLESIGTLAGGIAHDFNNLLTGIMGNIGLVKTSISPSDAAYEMLDEAEKAALRARDLTQQLLTFARGGKPVKKSVEIAEILKESAAFALRGSNVKLELSIPDDLWPIEADEGQINQVINNLIINADEAMPSGGTLKIQAENLTLKKMAIPLLPGGNYVHIDIADTGMGISPEHLERIFEPYFTTKQRGSGLGLTTAYSIVRNHGGIILADSRQNKGSTFQIYLPATKKTMKGDKKMKTVSSGQADGKVLVMDDDEIIRKMLKNMLSMAGYTVELSADGAEALEKYKHAIKTGDPFNAVIMDLTIPGGMGGREAVKKLLEIDPDATVIVSSGYATDPIMSEYKKYGFKAVIAKPYSVKQLQESLSSILTKGKK